VGSSSPVTMGAIAASHAIASAASPSSHAPSDPPPSDAAARHPAHRARTCSVHYADIVVMPICGRELLAAGAGGLAESA
jgi:hypothetical protein